MSLHGSVSVNRNGCNIEDNDVTYVCSDDSKRSK